MTRSLRPATVPGEIGHTKSRVSDLERRLARKRAEPLGYISEFSLPGAIFASTSGRDFHPTGARLYLVYAALDTAGSTTTVIDLLKNGSQFATIKMPADAEYNELNVDASFNARSDYLQAQVTTAGTGAEDLTVFGLFEQ